jgi:hypothetical protein
MTDGFLKRPAADVVADPNFRRFVRAFETGTLPGVPQQVVEGRFRASDGTVEEVLEQIVTDYPGTAGLDVILADIRRIGAYPERADVDELERRLGRLRPALEEWYRFMDGE